MNYIVLENEQKKNIQLDKNNVYQLKILTNMILTRARAQVDRLVITNTDSPSLHSLVQI